MFVIFVIFFLFKKLFLSRELSDANPVDFDSILKPDQKNFIAEAIDVRQMIQQSYDFRCKFDFFLRVNKLMLTKSADKSAKVLDEGKQHALQIQSKLMHCEQFHPVENWTTKKKMAFFA